MSRLYYLTGGTTREPRVIQYSRPRYQRSVATTATVLRAHGVGRESRVLVSFPFEPWAIGGVFRDASLECGAVVLPLGLHCLEPSLLGLIADFRPNVLCGSVGVLLRMNAGIRGAACSEGTVFHAGEPLREPQRRSCAALHNSRVVNVFGMAEFDTVAAEGTLGGDLILCPQFRYALKRHRKTEPSPLETGISGELLIRSTTKDAWFRTFDRVRILGKAGATEGLWPRSWCVEHLGRVDSLLKLPDGSSVSECQIARVADELRLHDCQIQVERRLGKPVRLVVVVSQSSGQTVNEAEVKRVLLATCLELSDSVSRSVVEIEIVNSPDGIVRTQRGKAKRFLEI